MEVMAALTPGKETGVGLDTAEKQQQQQLP
jgi:hypothetical protein